GGRRFPLRRARVWESNPGPNAAVRAVHASSGARGRTRTDGLTLTRRSLSQLSYAGGNLILSGILAFLRGSRVDAPSLTRPRYPRRSGQGKHLWPRSEQRGPSAHAA